MDRDTQHEEDEVKEDTERETFEEEDSPADSGKEREEAPADMVTSHQEEEEEEESGKVTEDPPGEAALCELPDTSNTSTSQDLEVNKHLLSHRESVVSDINSNCDDGRPSLHLDTPERETTSPAQEEEEEAEEEEATAAAEDTEDVRYEEYEQALRGLCRERDEASQHSSRLQMKLADFFCKKAGGEAEPRRERPAVTEQQYERSISVLTELQRQLAAGRAAAQQQAEQLRLQSHQQLDEVENEWRALLALKQDAAVTLLSQRLGAEAARAKVESALTAQQLRQDELTKLRLKHIKLRMKIGRLEAELRDGEHHGRDPLQIQFEQLQAERLEQKKHAEKRSEETLKLQRKMSSSLEVLSNVKEKLSWSQMEVQAKREQLAEVEALVARKRDLLTRTKQARNGLQRDNLRLRERRGLLGNGVLLRDFEDTVDASDHLEEQLESLKCRQAAMVFRSGR